jgi:hypothetical protein
MTKTREIGVKGLQLEGKRGWWGGQGGYCFATMDCIQGIK